MDKAYQNALALEKKLSEQLKKVRDFISLYQEFSSENTDPKLETKQEYVSSESIGVDSRSRRERSQGRKIGGREQFGVIAREVLLAERKALTRGELVNALEMRGYEVSGEDKAKNVGTIMWRLRDRFINIPGFGYWPIDKDYEPAGYNAATGRTRSDQVNLMDFTE
jgi:hypothetical protein